MHNTRKLRETTYPPRWWTTVIGPLSLNTFAQTKKKAQISAIEGAQAKMNLSRSELFKRYPRIRTRLKAGEPTIRELRKVGDMPRLKMDIQQEQGS